MKESDSRLFINRELSWLEFNQRVLDCAGDLEIPALERLKFLSITSSNLDEFFMVRVGSLHMLMKEDFSKTDASGLTTRQQYTLISYRVQKMIAQQHATFRNSILPELEENDIRFLAINECNDAQLKHCEYVFENEIFPVLSPVSLSNGRSFPLIANKTLYYLVRLKPETGRPQKSRFALLQIPSNLKRFITLPSKTGYHVILLEDVICYSMHAFFPQEEVLEKTLFRIARNADYTLQEDLAFDLIADMEEIVVARKRSDCVRLEIADTVSPGALNYCKRSLGVSPLAVYRQPAPLDFAAFMSLSTIRGHSRLNYEEWKPLHSPLVPLDKSVFSCVSAQDIVLYHPYESYDPMVRFLSEAADDPQVIAIKQTLYRTSGNSQIVAALKRAAENGKSVTVLVELKARFDEERNIDWARQLEDLGAQVIYGLRKLKVHAKICIIIRKEAQGIKRYMHFGTGNYNEKTAALYTDFSFFTADDILGHDASLFFNIITGYSRPQPYHKMDSAPLGLRNKFIELIEGEIGRKKDGEKAHIMIKCNALIDRKIIETLYRASRAGVKIDMNVRGMCCLRPGLRGVSESITIKSIVDRYLEHGRIYYFYHGGEEKVFLASADMMPRNLDRRIEHIVPVEDPACKKKVIRVLKTNLADTVNAWMLQSDGSYIRLKRPGGRKGIRSQEEIRRDFDAAVRNIRSSQALVFTPYRSPKHPV